MMLRDSWRSFVYIGVYFCIALYLRGVCSFAQASQRNIDVSSVIPKNISKCGVQKFKQYFVSLPSAEERVEVFKRQYAVEFKGVVDELDNTKFIKLIEVETTRAGLYFEMDNPILKQMNDIIFNDKDLSTAVTNKYKEIFFRKLNDQNRVDFRVLKEAQILAQYSDYKTIRLAFKNDSPHIRRALQTLYQETAKEFLQTIERLGLQRSAARGILADPAAWQLAGMGKTPDAAGMSVRYARIAFKEFQPGVPLAQQFEKIVPQLKARLDAIEKKRFEIEAKFAKQDGMLVAANGIRGPPYILSEEVLRIFRKVNVQGRGLSEYVQHITKRLEKRFKGLKISANDVVLLRDYLHMADTFSPGLYIAKHHRIPIEEAQYGIVSIDFAGLGAQNMSSTLKALVPRAASDSNVLMLLDTLKRARSLLDEVTETFEGKKIELEKLFKKSDSKGSSYFSGDDGMFFPSRSIDDFQKSEWMMNLAKRQNPAEVRVVFLPEKYASGSGIPASQRSSWITEGEGVEKKIRVALEGNPFQKEFDNTIIGVDLVPDQQMSGTVNLWIAGEGARNPSLMSLLQQTLAAILNSKSQAGRELYPGVIRVLEKKIGVVEQWDSVVWFA